MASVSDLLLQAARDQAEARRHRGALIGGAVSDLSQVPGQILAQSQAEERRKQGLLLQQQEAARKAAADQHLSERDDARLQLDRDKFTAEGAEKQRVLRQEQQGKQSVMGWLKQHGATLPDGAADRMLSVLEMPGGTQHVLAELSKAPDPFTLGDMRYDGKGNILASNPVAKPETRPLQVQANEALKAGNTQEYGRLLRVIRETGQAGKIIDPDDVPALTAGGLDAAAQMYAKTGQLPAMGMGGKSASVRATIINRAAALYPDLNIAANRADTAADADSLKAMQKQRDAIGAFEQTAAKNIDVFLNVAGKVVDTGSPLANRVARTVSGAVLGSPDQAAYDAARQVAINEIAKITSNLGGQLSDSARHEVEAFNPSTATLKQTVAVMRLLKRDMTNRTASLDEQMGTIKTRMGGTATASKTPSPSAGGLTYQDYLKAKEQK